MAKLLGFEVNEFTFDEAVEFAKQNRGQVVTINPEIIEQAKGNAGLAQIIHDAELVIPDGIGVQIGLKILGHNVRRIAGIDFARRMLEEMRGLPVALIGAKPHVIENAVKNLQAEIDGLNIVYSRNGYFKNEYDINEYNKTIDEVVLSKPELILVALGSPLQDYFIYELKSKLPKALMIGVGGSFDVWAGEVERAPVVYQKMGLEWLYRTLKDPKRFKRIFPTLPLFVLKVLLDGVKNVICKRN